MFKMKKKLALLLTLSLTVSASCMSVFAEEPVLTSVVAEAAQNTAVVSGKIAEVDKYGDIVPDFKVSALFEAGFEYGDILAVDIASVGRMEMPFVTNYSDVGTMHTSICDYGASHDEITIALTNASFADRVGGKAGDKITVSMAEKAGYLETYNSVQAIYTYDRADYDSDEEFGNFRMVTTPAVAEGVLYRGSSPISPSKNAVRYAYVDQLAQEAGIQTEIDLADSASKVDEYIAMEGFDAPYCGALYVNGQTATLNMGVDMFLDSNETKLAEGLRFMLSHEAPYLVHCNEGKDRAGFVLVVLEALAGASIEDIEADYMTTYTNYYGIEKGTDKYNKLQYMTVDRLIYILGNPEVLDNLGSVDWENIDISNVDVNRAVARYLFEDLGLTYDEIFTLQNILAGTSNS